MAQRRQVTAQDQAGFSVQDLILIAVLLAAGAVLKLTVSSFLSFAGMKPNFMIAMYALAIILVKPRVWQAAVVGLLTGLISQIPMLNATPMVNIASELLGGIACGVLLLVFMNIAKKNKACQNVIFPAIIAFFTTVVSGYTFALIVGCVMNGLPFVVCLATYAIMVFGTAAMNAVVVAVLTPVLRVVLKRQDVEEPAAVEVASADQPDQQQAAIKPQPAAAVRRPVVAPRARKQDFEPMIVVKDFTFKYVEGDAPIVKGINLTLGKGEFIGITGPAGSGKSTLTYAFNGIIPHCYPGDFYGSVTVDGMDTCTSSLTDVSRVVGSVCQDIDSQMVSAVVEDEILYGLENFGVPKEEIEQRIVDALADMGISDLRERSISGLSGGQKQKVAIAAILAMKPRVLVLDEPTAELDPASSVGVFQLLRDYAENNEITVIVVEQKIALLSDFVDRMLIVQDGQIRFEGTPEEVLAHSEELLEMGVNCPRATSLVNALRDKGLYSGAVCRNVDDAVEVCKEVLA